MSPGAEIDLGPGGATRAESVTEFTRRLKTLLEGGLRPGWVRGEVSNLRIQASGHVYFSLKDAGAQVRAVLFRGDAARQTVKLRDGGQVVAFGEVSVYEARGEYQLIVRAVVDDGVGRLQREFENLKARLAAEGLFARERKRALPRLPRTVGFVTSPTGAAAQDFCRILTRRAWRGRVVILPARVQGAGAAEEIAAMLAWANTIPAEGLNLETAVERRSIAQDVESIGDRGIPTCTQRVHGAGDAIGRRPTGCARRPDSTADSRLSLDLLVVGRGGGSLEDLWAFNEELLVRAVVASRIPVVSAVGHEIDFTLCDFAADARAETPSGAAELISSGFVANSERLAHLARGLAGETSAQLEASRLAWNALAKRLHLLSPAAQVERGWLRLDDLRNRLEGAWARVLQARRHHLALGAGRLAGAAPTRRVEQESQRLLGLWKRLQAASPASVLNRGFVIFRDANGRPLTRASELAPEARVRAQFADAEVRLTVDSRQTET